METPPKRSGIGETWTGFFRKAKAAPTEPARLISARRIPFGPFQFQIQTLKGVGYSVEASTDLRHWEAIHSGSTSGERTDYVDESPSKMPARFFRVAIGEGIPPSNSAGYVSVTIPPGYSMFPNPFNSENNRVEALLAGLPDETVLNKFDTTLFRLTKNELTNGRWSNPAELLAPGEGALILNPTSEFKLLTFAGRVAQGDLTLPIPAGFSIRSSLLPLPGRLDSELSFPIANGDVIHLFDRDQQKYVIYSYEANKWAPSPPVIAAGESFWVGKTSAGNWVQSSVLSKLSAAEKT